MLKSLFRSFLPVTSKRVAANNGDSVKLADELLAKGRRCEGEGRLTEACGHYREAIVVAPDYPEAHLNLGIALAAIGNNNAATQAYQQVLTLQADNAYACYNLANLLFIGGELAEAEQLFRTALKCKPEFPECYVALSNVLDSVNRPEEAIDALVVALHQRPDYIGALYNYSVLSNKLRRYEDAEDAIRQFLEHDPSNLDATQVLAFALWGQTRWAEALSEFQVLRKNIPWSLALESKELFLLNYDDLLSPEQLFQRHQEFGVRLEHAEPARFAEFQGSADSERRLRIGYVSPDYNWHPIGLFILPVVERHNREDIEVFCYYTGEKVDDVTQALRKLPDHWIDAANLTDTALSDLIHKDSIDILVDLTGHTSTSRLAVFAQQPAPVQVSWMGYLNTTGLTRIQYRLCDARTDPVGISDSLHTEELIRLPHSQWCYRPDIIMDVAQQAPCERSGFITFGSFNHSLKISPAVCACWAEILHRVPNSQLLCVGLTSTRKMAELLNELTLTGVDSERIRMVARTSLPQYFAWYNEVDVALDTFPYGGGTTTFDALWMGVPVMAATGNTPTSRSAASILAALGLEEWIAPSIDDYVRVAVDRANNRAAIAELRRTLRPRLQASPLMDEVQFVRDLEAAYRQMWRQYCTKVR